MVETRSKAKISKWSDLPRDLLLLIIDRLSFSIPDLLSAAAVCRSWHAATAAAAAADPGLWGPPLLLNPMLSSVRGPPHWRRLPECRLETLTPTPTKTKIYKAKVSSLNLRKRCIGCSHGNLIFVSGDRALLADVFTGAKILSPTFPSRSDGEAYDFQIGVLTSPALSEGSTLLLVDKSCTLFWRLGDYEWVMEKYLRYGVEIIALSVLSGKVYCLNSLYQVKVVDFDPPATWNTLEIQMPESVQGNEFSGFPTHFQTYLVGCGGDLLLVVFPSVRNLGLRIDVYRLDLSRVMWVKVENLGDWCLFIDVAGNCPIACSKPARWGGRSNCVYIVGPGYCNWSVFPLDGSVANLVNSALLASNKRYPQWPSPIWLYPTKLL